MTCVLRCYSTVREGPQLKKTDQQQKLFEFYHGKGDKYPSQIKLLSEGTSFYKDLYDVKSLRMVTSKKYGKKTKKTSKKTLMFAVPLLWNLMKC